MLMMPGYGVSPGISSLYSFKKALPWGRVGMGGPEIYFSQTVSFTLDYCFQRVKTRECDEDCRRFNGGIGLNCNF
jgi:hypothetical protein